MLAFAFEAAALASASACRISAKRALTMASSWSNDTLCVVVVLVLAVDVEVDVFVADVADDLSADVLLAVEAELFTAAVVGVCATGVVVAAAKLPLPDAEFGVRALMRASSLCVIAICSS